MIAHFQKQKISRQDKQEEHFTVILLMACFGNVQREDNPYELRLALSL